MALERAFAKAGGLLVAGTDPTGSGGVVPGFADQRQIELLVEAGFTPLEAICDRHARTARSYLGRDARIGTIAAGKQADLVVLAGNPAATIADIRQRRDGVQERRRLRSGEADRVRAGTGGRLVDGPAASLAGETGLVGR